MPDRIVRDELLESERWLSLKDNGDRLAYIALLLRADAHGNFDGGEYRLLRLWRDFGIGTPSLIAKTLAELSDHDLVRVYEIEGRRFVHVPRFRQSLRFAKKRVFPASPWDAEEINQRVAAKSHGEHMESTQSAPSAHPRREVKRREEKRSEVTTFAPNAIAFDAEAGRWQGISESDEALWRAAFPAVNVVAELNAAAAWARANPSNRKSNWRRFLTNWLKRAQDRAPRQPLTLPRGKVAL